MPSIFFPESQVSISSHDPAEVLSKAIPREYIPSFLGGPAEWTVPPGGYFGYVVRERERREEEERYMRGVLSFLVFNFFFLGLLSSCVRDFYPACFCFLWCTAVLSTDLFWRKRLWVLASASKLLLACKRKVLSSAGSSNSTRTTWASQCITVARAVTTTMIQIAR